MEIRPLDAEDYHCEACGKHITDAWFGRVEEHDLDGKYVGYSINCTDCMNVLARLADAIDELEGPSGPIRLED